MKYFFDRALAHFNPAAENAPALAANESPFINRELSWMEFNQRVLEEAKSKETPLYERLNFLAISCSNLDEFLMIRLTSVLELYEAGGKTDPAGFTAAMQRNALLKRIRRFYKQQYSCYKNRILPSLKEEKIRILEVEELSREQLAELEHYFERTVFPVLTPMAVDSARPFPLISGKTLNLLILLKNNVKKQMENAKGGKKKRAGEAEFPPFAILPIPSILPRLYRLQAAPPETAQFVLLENIIRLFMDRLFDHHAVCASAAFRFIRNGDFDIDEEENDLLSEIEYQVKLRQRGRVIVLQIDSECKAEIRELLIRHTGLPEDQVFDIRGPLDLSLVSLIPDQFKRSELHYPPFTGQLSPQFCAFPEAPFAAIRAQDILLSHPYESFDPVIEIIRRASRDPKVLAIKQTLYRVSGQSPIIAALAKAAEAGKQVLVLVELKARFDESANIHWARELERAGCHVLYGIKGLKTHSKITLIVRDEGEIRRYVHIGTGNYNDKTAKIYTDLGLWSCSEQLGEDASNFFNMISGYSIPSYWKQLIPAPDKLRGDTLFRILRETENARQGRKAMIVAKVNSLVDPEIITALYKASQAGVIIRIIARGISCLRPGIKGLSETIEVRSLVGRFLEHARIFYYYNDGAEDLLIGSADWMQRNLDRRIELTIPVTDAGCRERIFEILALQLTDTERTHLEGPDGLYKRVDRRGKETLDSQLELCRRASERARQFLSTGNGADHFEVYHSWEERSGSSGEQKHL